MDTVANATSAQERRQRGVEVVQIGRRSSPEAGRARAPSGEARGYLDQTREDTGVSQTCSEAVRANEAASTRSEGTGVLLEVVRTWDSRRSGVSMTGAAERDLGSSEKKADGGADYPRQGPESYSKRWRSKKRKNLS